MDLNYICIKKYENDTTMDRLATNRVLLIYTGGTIGMGKNAGTGALEPLDFRLLMDRIPELRQLDVEVDVNQFSPAIDSSDMSPQLWVKIATIVLGAYSEYDGFVILHGTDTMAYTASALSFMLGNLTKPVVLTGSQLPIGQLRTDGKENLITSIELAATKQADGRAMVPEVCIYFNGHLLRGNRATKQNADGFNAFDSFNYPHLCDAGVTFTFRSHHILQPDFHAPVTPFLSLNPNVIVFSLFPGLQENLVKHLLDAPELKGIVMRTFGSGNAPQKEWITTLLRNACERGVVVVNISQCLSGQVAMGRYGTGYQLQDAGVISGHDSTVEAAVTKLMHLLGTYSDYKTVCELMNRSLAGEISVSENV